MKLTAAQKRKLRRQKGCCHYCGKSMGKRVTRDHVIPKSKRGTLAPDNVVLACGPCNWRKGSMSYADFVKTLPKQPFQPAIITPPPSELDQRANNSPRTNRATA